MPFPSPKDLSARLCRDQLYPIWVLAFGILQKTLKYNPWPSMLSKNAIEIRRSEGGEKFGDIVEVDWKQAGSDDVSWMSLPNDNKVEITKENEEPAEFLSLLRSLWH